MLTLRPNLARPTQPQIQECPSRASVQPLNLDSILSRIPLRPLAHSSGQFSRPLAPNRVSRGVKRMENIGRGLLVTVAAAVVAGSTKPSQTCYTPDDRPLPAQRIPDPVMHDELLRLRQEWPERDAIAQSLHNRIVIWQDHVRGARGSRSINHEWLIKAIREVKVFLDKSHIQGLKELKLLIREQDYMFGGTLSLPVGVDISALNHPNRYDRKYSHKTDPGTPYFNAYGAACDRLEDNIQDLIETLESDCHPARIGGLPMQAPNHASKL